MPKDGGSERRVSNLAGAMAPSAPELPHAKSHFVPGPAVEKSLDTNEGSMQEYVRGKSPGNVPFITKISGPPGNFDLP
eukprot:2537786-Pyramimonas_sp.AAC.1